MKQSSVKTAQHQEQSKPAFLGLTGDGQAIYSMPDGTLTVREYNHAESLMDATFKAITKETS